MILKELSSQLLYSPITSFSHCNFRPFVIDLESTNGTHVNDEVIPAARYYELKAGDGKFHDVWII